MNAKQALTILLLTVVHCESPCHTCSPLLEPALLRGEPVVNFLSATLGDHMVLQRAPHEAVVWGSASSGVKVSTTFKGQTFTAIADKDGIWRQKLPATSASLKAYTIDFSASSGETASLKDVLFGDVYICGGQSNMEFIMHHIENSTAEIQKANNYSNIRLFTVGQGTQSTTPLLDLQTVEQRWAVADNLTVAGGVGFGEVRKHGYFSAVCWFFGQRISDYTNGDLPVGLISSNWGGTKVELWSTTGAFAACNRTSPNGNLFNAMINPYTVGPMAVAGFAWYQGEANTKNQASADDYACLFPAMISAWRSAFGNTSAYFGFIQLSTYCRLHRVLSIPEMREAQMKALELDMVGYATNADHGDGCNIHPPAKQFCGKRLGTSALALLYGVKLPWRSPSFVSAKFYISGLQAGAQVILKDVVGELEAIYPFNYVPGLNCTAQVPGTCGWAALEITGLGWINATISIWGSTLLLEASLPTSDAFTSVIGTAYGWAPIPMLSIYDKSTGLPVLPWNQSTIKIAKSQEY